jgi:hypothetical protein
MALDQFRLKTAFKAAADYCKKNTRSALGISLMVAGGITLLAGGGVPTLCLAFASALAGSLGTHAAHAGYKAYKNTAPAPSTTTP